MNTLTQRAPAFRILKLSYELKRDLTAKVELAGLPEQARRLPQTHWESLQCPARLRTLAQFICSHNMEHKPSPGQRGR